MSSSGNSKKLPEKYILLNPGPVNTSKKVKQSLLRGDLCHREKEFSNLLLKVRQNLLKAFGLKNYFPIFLSGSGTLALETALVSTLDPKRKVLVLSNGVYGDRIEKIISLHGFRKEIIKVHLGEPLPLDRINQLLLSDSEIESVAMVHHETSTGMLNPLRKIAQLKGMKGKRLIVDAISSLGGEEISWGEIPIHVCVGTANKCIQGLPGVSFVLLREGELEKMHSFPPRSLYLDLKTYWKEQESGGVPFTPAVQTFYALDTALEELIEEGVKNRIQRYQQYSARFRQGFENLGLEYLIDPKYHSGTLTALKLPAGVSYDALHDQLKAQGFVIYAGQGDLKTKIFRVANMGNLKLKDIDRFLKCLEKIIK
ncbi:MAG: alanine--glyoxylate aminotransferase family protein [Chlamydiae bacterium]|nr:alanine--glyoxylate aminotransferase family protein [Chlamydiota bacterium]MBI3277263.1 alanine--glyoxylate aminotransferase family protein [Chlamydiota bacterium]